MSINIGVPAQPEDENQKKDDGGYVVDGAYLTIGQVATTRMYCQAVWSQERAILDTLPLVTRWQVADDRLELIGGTGLVLAVFQAEPGAN